MKNLISSTAIAMLIASGAIAESHVSADGSSEEQMNEDGETMVDEIQETVPSEGDAETEGEMSSEGDTMSDDGTMTEGDTMSDGDSMSEGDTMTDDGTMTDDSTMSTDDSTMTDDGTMTDDSMTDDTMEEDGMSTDTAESDMGDMGPMDGYSELASADVTVEQIQGAAVYGGDNNELGNVNDMVVTADGTIDQVIIDVGGFLGIGEKPVALPFDTVTVMQQDDGDTIRVFVQETEEQLEEMEEYTGEM